MIEAVGFDVTYFDSAFRTTHSQGQPPYPPSFMQLRRAIDRGARSVYQKGGGRWMVVDKDTLNINYPNDEVEYHVSSVTVELVFLVPQRSARSTELLAAIAHFEEVVAEYLGVPVDTRFRTIEDASPKCEICGKKSTWARAIRILRFLDNAHFCSDHAKDQKDFHHSGSSDFFWRHLGPTNT
ncbi:hypothetical protein D3C85_1095890 [compost metagenome]